MHKCCLDHNQKKIQSYYALHTAHLPAILDTGIKLVGEGDSNRLEQTMIDR